MRQPKKPLYPRIPRSLWYVPAGAPGANCYPVTRGLEVPYEGALWSVIGWDTKTRAVYIAHGGEVCVIRNQNQLSTQFRMQWLPNNFKITKP